MNYFMIDNLVFGGAERQATYLINNGINFDEIILLEDVKKYKINTTKPIQTLNPKILKIYQRPFDDIKNRNKLTRVFNSQDIVLSFLERSNILNIKTSLVTKHKSIISVRNFLSERYNNPKYFYRMQQIRKYYPLADVVIANSMDSKNDLVNNFNVAEEKVKVIYNLIDLDNIEILKRQKLEQEHEHIFRNPVILNIGSLTPQKAQAQLIEAFKLVKVHHPEYKLVIIGSGKLEKDLRKVIAENNLIDEVYLLGNVSNPFKYLNASDMFVLNSDFEGFPNVLLEALAVGIPVISKNCLSGPREMLEVANYNNKEILLMDYGYLIPKKYEKNPANYEEEKVNLFKSIIGLINIIKNDASSYKNFKSKCIKRAKDFSGKEIMDQWFNIIN